MQGEVLQEEVLQEEVLEGLQEVVESPVQEGLVKEVMEECVEGVQGAVASTSVKQEPEQQLPCLQCGKVFSGRKKLASHKQNCHDITSVCTECGKSYSSRKYMKRHIKDVHGGRAHNCTKCSQGFKSRAALKVHLTTCGVHKARRGRPPGIQCHMCPMMFSSSFNLKKHVWSQHCILLRDSTTSLKRRRRTRVTRQPRVWSCDQCDLTFKKKYGLHRHMDMHRRQDQVTIQVCGFQGCAFSCQPWAVMRSHKEEEHKGMKVFSCDKCDKSFPKFRRLVAHKNRVHSSLLHKCMGEDGNSGCGKEFMRKDYLKKHLKVCGTPMVKPWALLSYSQKRRRTKKKAAQFKADLEAMDGEERKAYIATVLKDNPEYLDSLASNPFTTEDIIEVRFIIHMVGP